MSEEKPTHHQVPQMLLRRWANAKGRVKWSRRGLGRWDAKRPEKIMRRRGAYRLPFAADQEAAEKALSRLENDANEVINKVLKELERFGPRRENYEVGEWKPIEVRILRTFVVLQYSRAEAVRENLTRAHPVEKTMEGFERDTEANPQLAGKAAVNPSWVEKMHQQMVVQAQLFLGPEKGFLKHFEDMEIVVGVVDLDTPKLALTDTPAMKIGPRRTDWDEQRRNNVGIPGKDEEVRLMLPVDSRYALMLKMPEDEQGPRRIENIRRAVGTTWLRHMAERHREVVVPWEDSETRRFFED